ELKTARRVKAWDEKRTDPKLTRKVTIMLPEDEHKELSKKAAARGVDLSKYIRQLLKGESGG
ncbi:MAG: ribbon-helix-helix protein, CopG family, partial [Syntrophales bacterium]